MDLASHTTARWSQVSSNTAQPPLACAFFKSLPLFGCGPQHSDSCMPNTLAMCQPVPENAAAADAGLAWEYSFDTAVHLRRPAADPGRWELACCSMFLSSPDMFLALLDGLAVQPQQLACLRLECTDVNLVDSAEGAWPALPGMTRLALDDAYFIRDWDRLLQRAPNLEVGLPNARVCSSNRCSVPAPTPRGTLLIPPGLPTLQVLSLYCNWADAANGRRCWATWRTMHLACAHWSASIASIWSCGLGRTCKVRLVCAASNGQVH